MADVDNIQVVSKKELLKLGKEIAALNLAFVKTVAAFEGIAGEGAAQPKKKKAKRKAKASKAETPSETLQQGAAQEAPAVVVAPVAPVKAEPKPAAKVTPIKAPTKLPVPAKTAGSKMPRIPSAAASH